jgi:hypothetical protein
MSRQLVVEATTRTTHNKQKTRKNNSLSAIQTQDLRDQAAADLLLCPHGHRDWLLLILFPLVSLNLRTLQLILPPQVSLTLRMHAIVPIRSACSAHPRYNNHNIQNTKPLIIQFSPASCYVFSLGFSYGVNPPNPTPR